MKRITVNSRVQILENVQSDFSEHTIPAGTMGTIVEYYKNPEGYAIDLAMPDGNMTGGFIYENVILTPEQFIVIGSASNSWEKSDISVCFESEKKETYHADSAV